jgi:hypothetical protein
VINRGSSSAESKHRYSKTVSSETEEELELASLTTLVWDEGEDDATRFLCQVIIRPSCIL